MPRQQLFLRSATLASGQVVDVEISEGRVTKVQSSLTPTSNAQVIDLTDHILTSSFVEPHAHLDKAFLADRVQNPSGDLEGAIAGLHEVRETLTFDDTVKRAVRAAQVMSRNGVTVVRTHADTMVETGLQNVNALLEAKRLCASFIDIQVAMLLEWPLSGPGSAARHDLANDAIAAGVDVVGGCPHLDHNPHAAIEYLLQLAVENDRPLDLHADENLRPDSNDLEFLADFMLANNIHHQVNASHCVSLSTREPKDIERIAEKVAAAGITVTALPQTNLFLQSRFIHTLAPRAITPIQLLRTAGVTVAAGADNLQDPFNLVGRADPLEIASLLVTAAHIGVVNAYEMISTNASLAIGKTPSNVRVGDKANLVALPATTLRESIAMGPPDRIVVYGGVVMNEQIRNRK